MRICVGFQSNMRYGLIIEIVALQRIFLHFVMCRDKC